jgi:hypothetical protein
MRRTRRFGEGECAGGENERDGGDGGCKLHAGFLATLLMAQS